MSNSKPANDRQGGGSSEPNGANERANDAGKSAGLDREQMSELHDRIHGQNLTFKEIQEIAKEIKKG